ncbi:M24 family metallopeptidase [Natronomonas sp.]|uniref:M24 family metallopeptidase n=1 Tax=Natronomonas sp. TaxID=2184060 RepID=UPI002620CC4A|nr:Xaa-Pro peptidase family protein [Natronomonas sp.]
MSRDFSKLDRFIEETGVDGFLIDADSDEADQLYLSGFDAPDPFHTLYDGEIHLLVSGLEYGRAKEDAAAATVERHADYDLTAATEEHGQPEAARRVLADFCREYGVESVATPARFPLATADGLREQGVSVATPDAPPIGRGTDVVERMRATKTDEEIDAIRTTQRAGALAMRTAEEMLRETTVRSGTLYHDDEPLTSERVKTEIEVTLLERNCGLRRRIVACGSDAADPHERGSGPLRANEPIIIDIFPRDKGTNYFGDMTRTFVVGEPDETVREWYDLTADAKEAAIGAIEPGVTGEDVHDVVCDVYEDAGLPTLRSDEDAETGFIHSTGHGVGLDIHELPRVGTGGDELEAGNVLTVEPGLYDPAVGGVRIEDLVVVTEDGYENLTDYEETLRIEPNG